MTTLSEPVRRVRRVRRVWKVWKVWLALTEFKTLRVDEVVLPPEPTADQLHTALSIYMFDPEEVIHVRVRCPESGARMVVCGTPYQKNSYAVTRNYWLPMCMGPVAIVGAGLTRMVDIGQGSALFALEAVRQLKKNAALTQTVWLYGTDGDAGEPREVHLQGELTLEEQCRRWLGGTEVVLGQIQVKTGALTPMTILGRMGGTDMEPNSNAPGLFGPILIIGGRLDTTTEPRTWELQEISEAEIDRHFVYLQQNHKSNTLLQPILLAN